MGPPKPRARQALQLCPALSEEALKAFLIANGQAYPLTHSPETLRRLCCSLDETLDATAGPGLDLTPFAGLMRYPGSGEDPAIEIARGWVLPPKLSSPPSPPASPTPACHNRQ